MEQSLFLLLCLCSPWRVAKAYTSEGRGKASGQGVGNRRPWSSHLHLWGKQRQWLWWVVVADNWLDGDDSSVLAQVREEEGKLAEQKCSI
jgi:hypothetical protein